jgi:hypothetical protein
LQLFDACEPPRFAIGSILPSPAARHRREGYAVTAAQ